MNETKKETLKTVGSTVSMARKLEPMTTLMKAQVTLQMTMKLNTRSAGMKLREGSF